MKHKTIGKIANEAGVNVQTVLYYERRGLLMPVSRTPSGYRLFDQAAVQRILFIKQAQVLGFSLKQVKTLLSLQEKQDASCANVRTLAAQHLEDIEQKIHHLQGMRDALIPLVDACPGDQAALKECPVLDKLEDQQ